VQAEDSDEDDGDVHLSSDEEGPEDPKVSSKPTKASVRTKYDRMFERKNQNILSAHYTKLIDHQTDRAADDDDEFITLARADHDLPDLSEGIPSQQDILSANLSKRKQKLGRAKRALLTTGANKKLVFDEEGRAREVYGVQEGEEWVREKGGVEGVFEEGRKFAEGERGRMREADVKDKQEAREKKKEKKRKRKERENESDLGYAGPVVAGALLSNDGYISPDFDLPSSGEDEEIGPPPKRSKGSNYPIQKQQHTRTIEDDEELALQLLRNKR